MELLRSPDEVFQNLLKFFPEKMLFRNSKSSSRYSFGLKRGSWSMLLSQSGLHCMVLHVCMLAESDSAGGLSCVWVMKGKRLIEEVGIKRDLEYI